MKMLKGKIVFLIGCFGVLMVCYVYGLGAATYPFMSLLWFFTFFGTLTVRAWIQESANTGIERMSEPDWCFSSIYDAWLYVNDRKSWAVYVSILSVIGGIVLGPAFGLLLVVILKIGLSQTASFFSCLSGILLMSSAAMLIANSNYWSKE